MREYHQRYKICEFHLKAQAVVKDGTTQRFCQQVRARRGRGGWGPGRRGGDTPDLVVGLHAGWQS